MENILQIVFYETSFLSVQEVFYETGFLSVQEVVKQTCMGRRL